MRIPRKTKKVIAAICVRKAGPRPGSRGHHRLRRCTQIMSRRLRERRFAPGFVPTDEGIEALAWMEAIVACLDGTLEYAE